MWNEIAGCIWREENRANIINMTSIMGTVVTEKVAVKVAEKGTVRATSMIVRIKPL
jgi:NADP-dependent 3-hydroxy acid dehydrogenase YdfG